MLAVDRKAKRKIPTWCCSSTRLASGQVKMCQVTVFWSRGERYDSDSDETYGFVVEDAPPILITKSGRQLEAATFEERR